MQAYLMYGYGINPSKITEEELRVITELKNSETMFCWFNEDDVSTETEGVYYLIGVSPFHKTRTSYNDAWAISFTEMEKFKTENKEALDIFIEENHLEGLRKHIEFHCSCFSI